MNTGEAQLGASLRGWLLFPRTMTLSGTLTRAGGSCQGMGFVTQGVPNCCTHKSYSLAPQHSQEVSGARAEAQRAAPG